MFEFAKTEWISTFLSYFRLNDFTRLETRSLKSLLLSAIGLPLTFSFSSWKFLWHCQNFFHNSLISNWSHEVPKFGKKLMLKWRPISKWCEGRNCWEWKTAFWAVKALQGCRPYQILIRKMGLLPVRLLNYFVKLMILRM